jgi:hypothetical protein
MSLILSYGGIFVVLVGLNCNSEQESGMQMNAHHITCMHQSELQIILPVYHTGLVLDDTMTKLIPSLHNRPIMGL